MNDDNLRKKMGIAGRKFVEETFEQKTFIEKYMENRMNLLKERVV